MPAPDKTPAISRLLVEHLERLYPDRSPDPSTPDRKVWVDAGAVQVVRYLRRVLTQQEQNTLKG